MGVTRRYRLMRDPCLFLILMLVFSTVAYIGFIPIQPVFASPGISDQAMIVYGEGALTTPRSREWNGTILGSEVTGPTMGATIHYVVLKSCPIVRVVPNEKMLVVSNDGGNVYASVWVGGWGAVKTLGTAVLSDVACRGFHVAYEQSSGDCMIVVRSGADVKYWIWDGSSWTVDGATLDLTVTTGNPVWIKLAADPLSDEIALIWLDSNLDVGGAIWSGSAWGNQLLLDGTNLTAEMGDNEVIAVRYMAGNGEAMFAWGGDDQPSNTESGIGSRVWNGTSWDSSEAWEAIGDDGYPPLGLSLKADPNSNQLMLAVVDDALDINTVRWSGSAWDSAVEHDDSIESGCRDARCADVEWENVTGHSGHAIVAWNSGVDDLETKHWDGSAWGSLISTDPYAQLTDQHVVQLRRNADGKIFVSMLDDAQDLHVWYWDSVSGAWVYSGSGLGEIETSVSVDKLYEPFEFAPDTHVSFVPPAPIFVYPANVTDLSLTPETSLTLKPDGDSLTDWYPATTIRPDGDGTFTDWTGDYTDWDEAASDGDATYVNVTVVNKNESSTLTNPPSLLGSISKVKVVITARTNITTDEKVQPMLVIGTTAYLGTAVSLTSAYKIYTSEWATNPSTASAWQWTDLTNLEAGVNSVQTGGSWTGEIRVTQLRVDIVATTTDQDYTYWNETTQNGDTDYVYMDYQWGYETSTLENSTSETWDIAKVKVTIFARNTTSTDEKVSPLIFVSGSEFWGPMYSFTGETSGGAYVKLTTEWAINPYTDTYWTWSDIDSLEAGVVSIEGDDTSWDDGLEIRVTQIYVEVTGPLLEVDIWVYNIETLHSYQFEMTYNPEVINNVWYDQGDPDRGPTKVGPFLGSGGGNVKVAKGEGYNNTLGKLFLTGAYLTQPDVKYCPNGTGHLATVFFEVVGKGDSNLTLGELTGLLYPPELGGDFIMKGREYVEDGYFRNADLASMPKALFTVTPVGTPVPLEGYNTTFDATSSTPNGGTIVTYNWYFWKVYHGAFYETYNETLSEEIPWGIITGSVTTQNFTKRGTWNLTLIVIDDAGYVGITETYITIKTHDIYFLDITTNATLRPLPPAIIPMANIGDIVKVNITAVNQGDFTETFNVTCFWDADYQAATHYGPIGVGTKYNINLAAGANTTLTFYWDTTGRNITHPGRFNIHANASAVQYEYDREQSPTKIADNEYMIAGPRIRFHDIAITQVTTNTTNVTPGEVVEVEVEVENQGDYNQTALDITAYYDGTVISTKTIPLMTNSSFATAELPGNDTATLTFYWDTTGDGGTYTIKAMNTTVCISDIYGSPGPDDYEPHDNTFIDGTVTVQSAVPEFPFGAALEIALVMVIIYVWWRKGRRKNRSSQKLFSNHQRRNKIYISANQLH